MLVTVGDLVDDVVVWLDEPVRAGTDTPVDRIEWRRGGSAANVATFAAAAGARVRFVGQVGDDRRGAALVAELEASGVECRVAVAGRSGTIVVLVGPDGERSMLPDRGAAVALAEAPPGALDGVRWLHVPVYSLAVEPLASTAQALVHEARHAGARVSLDASSVSVLEALGDARGLVDRVAPDVLFANADEARLLRLLDDPPPRSTVVVKDGPRPVTVVEPGRPAWIVEVAPVEVTRDSTGAGDAFAAGWLAAALAGAVPAGAAAAGIALARRVLAVPGAQLAPEVC